MAKRKFRELPEIYEPSTAQRLPDGRILVLEDEAHRPYSLLTFKSEKKVKKREINHKQVEDENSADLLRDMADLEAMDVDADSRVYVITSHSRRDKDGRRSDKRNRLLRFRLDGEVIRDVTLAPPLLPPLLETFPELRPAAEERDVKRGNGLNIEGMAFSPDREKLLIGFRSPVMGPGQHAVIAVLTNPESVFANGATPEFAEPLITLDLEGGGIRSLDHNPVLDGYLVVSGRAGGKEQPFRLWHWRGEPDQRPTPLEIDGLKSLEQAEGITPVTLPDREALLLVSDDGDEKKKKGAGYLIVDYADLKGLPKG